MPEAVKKAIEITDAKIQFVSLVDKAANMRQFLIAKAEDGGAQFSTLGKILKVDADTHYVTGIVYEPLAEDAHGNFMTEDEIRKAAYWFAKNGDKVDLQHSFESVDGVTVVETYVAPCDMEIGGATVIGVTPDNFLNIRLILEQFLNTPRAVLNTRRGTRKAAARHRLPELGESHTPT